MLTASYMVRTLVVFSVVACGCGPDAVVESGDYSTWRSENFDVSATLLPGWRKSHVKSPGDTYDRPGKLLAAFLNNSGPYSYILKIEDDVPLEQVSHEDFLDANRSQYASQPGYKLVEEDNVELHGYKFHRFRLRFQGTKGPGALDAHLFRDGAHFISVQWTFPLGSDAPLEVPEPLRRFDDAVSIKLRARPTSEITMP